MRIAALDLGSNSFHLVVAEARPEGSFEILARDKEVLRLGSVVASTGEIGQAGSEAAIDAIRRFRALASSFGATEVVACATSAFREARDSTVLVDRVAREAGVKVRVISGKEEARLIFKAVRASVVIDPAPALAVDLGGGSLELMIGGPARLDWSASLKLGVARLTAGAVRSDPPSAGDRRRLYGAVGRSLERVAGEVERRRPRMVIGSSGTMGALIRLVAARRSGQVPQSVNQLAVSASDLEAVTAEILRMTSAERAALPGVDALRAELLPAGAVLACAVLEMSGATELVGCDWALREGMVLDAIGSRSPAELSNDPGAMRRESVLELCRRCGWNEVHSTKVARLAMQLFDGMAGMHQLEVPDRELLEMGALLHDVGEHVSAEGHERHSAYLIENGRLRGFRPEEILVLACLGRFHKRGTPKTSFEPFSRLGAAERERVTKLTAILQVADGLDRSHGGPVQAVDVFASPGLVEVVVVQTDDDIDLELWGLRRKRELFEKVFACRLEVVRSQMELPLSMDAELDPARY